MKQKQFRTKEKREKEEERTVGGGWTTQHTKFIMFMFYLN